MKTKPTIQIAPDTLPLQQFLTYKLSRVQAKLNAQANAMLRDYAGLTLSQWRVLALIGGAGQTRLSDLVKSSALDKGLLSRNIKILTKSELICAKQDDLDQRVQDLTLTQKGQSVFEKVLPKMRKRQQHLRESLSSNELDVLFKVLDKLELAAGFRGEEKS